MNNLLKVLAIIAFILYIISCGGPIGYVKDDVLPSEAEQLIQKLERGNLNEQREAAKKLGNYKYKKVLIALVKAYVSKDEQLKKNIVNSIDSMGMEAVNTLISFLKNNNTPVLSKYSSIILGKMGNKSVDLLVDNLKKNYENKHFRQGLVNALINSKKYCADKMFELIRSNQPKPLLKAVSSVVAKILDKTLLEKLINELKTNNSELTRFYIIRALGLSKNKKAKDMLVSMLNDKSKNVRYIAVRALGRVGDESVFESIKRFMEETDSVKLITGGLIALCELKYYEDITFLIISFERICEKDNTEDFRYVTDAAVSMSKLGPYIIPPLINLHNHSNYVVRAYSIFIIGLIKDPRAVKYIASQLYDQEQMVRFEAVCALRRINSKQAIKPLKKLLEYEADIYVIREAALTLVSLGDKSDFTIKYLKKAIDNLAIEDKVYIDRIASALVNIGNNKKLKESVLKMLKGNNPVEQVIACRYYSKSLNKSMINELKNCYRNTKNLIVKSEAREALKKLDVQVDE